MDRLQTNEVADLRREVEKLKQANTFSKYELYIILDAVNELHEQWLNKVEEGADVSEKYMRSFTLIEAKLEAMIKNLRELPQ